MSWPRLRSAVPPAADREALSAQATARQLAVALRYDQADRAPRLVAKGRGELARAIVGLAAEHGVPIEQDADLAAVLEQLELQQEIPEELYRVIAELLVFLYRANEEYS